MTHTDVAIIGAGFAGLAMAYRLQEAGRTDFTILERSDRLGGTWRDNTYPGCQCDVPSHLYSFSFAPNPDWSRTYSRQPEIQAYLEATAQRFGLDRRVEFSTEVTGASWDETAGHWEIETSRGPRTARVLVAGFGGLSEPRLPDVPGIEDFEGDQWHTARWNHDVPLEGKRVAVIGTGASAIQVVPAIQPRCGRLAVFQRTPPWILPHSDRPVTRLEKWLYRALPALQHIPRQFVYWSREAVVPGIVRNQALLKPLEARARQHLRKQISDPVLREKLTPAFRIFCKRILVSDKWYPALAQPNVDVITEGIERVSAQGIVTRDGVEHAFDAIVWATGFHVVDDFSERLPAKLRGRDGRTMVEHWDGSPQAYLGTAVTGFPNLFVLLGPHCGTGHTSVVFMAESQVAYVMGALRQMDVERAGALDVRPEAQAEFIREVDQRMTGTVWMNGGCSSWYVDPKGRNSVAWPGQTFSFRRRLARFDRENYERLAGAA